MLAPRSVLVLLYALNASIESSIGQPQSSRQTCGSFREIVTKSVVESAISFFSDNSLSPQRHFIPSRKELQDISTVFEAYFGNGASTRRFWISLMQIVNAADGNLYATDRLQLRNDIRRFANDQGFDLTRRKIGVLLQRDVADLIGADWRISHCVYENNLDAVQRTVVAELSRIRDDIGDQLFSELLSLNTGTVLNLVIDSTGSMAQEIEAVKTRTKLLIHDLSNTIDHLRSLTFVPFNDPKVGPATSTSDSQALLSAFDNVYAHGGGDLPELSMRGLLLALQRAERDSTIYVVTDAEAKDAELQDQIIAYAQSRNIRVVFLLTEQIVSWLCVGLASPRRLIACKNPALKLGGELYEYIANETGGESLSIGRNTIFQSTEIFKLSLRHAEVNLDERISGEQGRIQVFVDSSVTELYVRSALSCDQVQIRFNGTLLASTVSITVDHLLHAKLDVGKVYGKYIVIVSSSSSCKTIVSGKSNKGFVYNVARITPGWNGSESLDILSDGNPAIHETVVVLLDMYGFQSGDIVKNVQFVDRAGSAVQTIQITEGHMRHFEVRINVTTDVFVAVSGIDAMRFGIRRVASKPIRIAKAVIDCSSFDTAIFRPGVPGRVQIKVTNLLNRSASFSVTVQDERNYVTSVSQSRIAISAKAKGRFFVLYHPPQTALPNTVSKVMLTASTDDVSTYRTCYLKVTPATLAALRSYAVVSNVYLRMAEVTITSRQEATSGSGSRAEFLAITPRDAMISSFTMTVDGTAYAGQVTPLKNASSYYHPGKGEIPRLWSLFDLDQVSIFQTSINLRDGSYAIFELKYQQLMRRTRGRYEHRINLRPGQITDDFRLEINIKEDNTVHKVTATKFHTQQANISKSFTLEGIVIEEKRNAARVTFDPPTDVQRRISPDGLNGHLTIEYAVASESVLNTVPLNSRRFVNFVVPDYPAMKVRVVFLLDDSLSMFGKKLEIALTELKHLISTLTPYDSFAIVTYNSIHQRIRTSPDGRKNSSMVLATATNIAKVNTWLDRVVAQGSRGCILKAMEASISILESYGQEQGVKLHYSSDFIVLLTDRLSADGMRTPNDILAEITDLNKKHAIHVFSIGSSTDKDALSNLASRNHGRYIHNNGDIFSSQMLKGIFEDISSPAMYDIEIFYPSDLVTPITAVKFGAVQKGSELILVVKTLKDCSSDGKLYANVTIRGTTVAGLISDVMNIPLHILCNVKEQKSYAGNHATYLQVRELLRQSRNTIADAAIIEEDILKIATENDLVVRDYTTFLLPQPDGSFQLDDYIVSTLDPQTANTSNSTKNVSTISTTLPSRTIPGGVVVTPAPRFLTVSTLDPPVTASRPRLEFFGDPHFVVDLDEQITLCFNWHGPNGQVVNLLHDPENSVTVNGEISEYDGPRPRARRTYVTRLGILTGHGTRVIITCDVIKIQYPDGRRVRLPLRKIGAWRRPNLHVTVSGVLKTRATVMVRLRMDLLFRVIAHVNSKNPYVRNHLDFAVIERSGLTESVTGMLGIFSQYKSAAKDSVSIEFRNGGKSALLWLKDNPLEVSYHNLRDYYTGRDVECWCLAHNEQMWEQNRNYLVLKNLLDTPTDDIFEKPKY